MGSTASKTFYTNGVINLPQGVRYVTVTTVKRCQNADSRPCVNGMGFIDVNQNLYVMGNNQSGVLGVGDVTNRSSPVPVAGTQLFTLLTGGNNNANFATNNIGQLYSWGSDGANGYKGDGTSGDSSSPTLVVGGLTFQSFSPGNSHCLALDFSGKAYSWGNNQSGQLGDNTVVKKSSPVAIVGGLVFQKVVALANGSFGLTPDGSLYSWGAGSSGELGLANSGTVKSSPTLIAGGFVWRDVKASNTSANFVLALRNNGTLYGTGLNDVGQLGTGDASNRDTFSNNQLNNPTQGFFEQFFLPITTTTPSCFGITDRGTTYGWGHNGGGQLGDGTSTFRSSPVLVAGSLKFVKIITTGGPSNGAGLLACTLGLTVDGKIYAWGYNTEGSLGDGTSISRSSPTLVIGGYTWLDFYCNYGGSIFGLTTLGQIYAWGRNDTGELGLGDTASRSSPTLVLGSFFQNNMPTITTTRVPVTPNNQYTISFKYFATFAGVVVGQQIDSMTITWQQ